MRKRTGRILSAFCCGKQYSDKEYEALNGSLVRRIGTLNCGHNAFPIILGVNEPQYTKAQLEKFREDNEKGVTVDGRHYTGYEATQMQRKIERSIRAQKRRVLVDETTGDKEKLLTDQIKLQRYKQEYSRFSKAAGLRTEDERAQVAGFGRREATKAVKATERKFRELLEKAEEYGKIDLDEDMEHIIAGKPFSAIQPLRRKLSDRAVRRWYNTQDAQIPFLIDKTLNLEDQARQACALRNQNRTNARELMRNQKKRRELDISDPNKSFEELIADKMARKNLTREEAIEDILRTASRTRKSVNRQLGLG
ncbi:MAG: hypothetical protein E7429_01950 [Ruminococcaceae bacterium]|nr:hypothetical protein [Oscillospiraceae bacterium]